ncbi:MAG: transporter related protein [Marmoricola sp.]|jgi:ABC-type sugar transport system ATPase subunit|nr:transporter related protein [Marmoricola sp.]
MTTSQPHIELRDVGKRFGGVQAVSGVSLRIERGTIHALVGENGAGKSTLGKMIAGVHRPDAGEMRVDGRLVRYSSPREALADGVTIIAQELALVPQRSVIENVFLGNAGVAKSAGSLRDQRRRYGELQDLAGYAVPPDVRISSLRVADQQKVEILKALAREARLIVMDEPTAALTAEETARLFEVVRGLRDRGTSIVFVSHFLDEVLSLVDTVSIMRDGKLVRTRPAVEETSESLVTGMLGRSLDTSFPPKVPPAPSAPVVLSVRDLSASGLVEDVSFDVRAGEIVGLAGLVGSGRSEIARALFGADTKSSGDVSIGGDRIDVRSPRDGVRAGIALLPEDRKDQGLLMQRSILHNITLPHLGRVSRAGVVSRGRERRAALDLISRIGIRASGPMAAVSTLSGGNQQKVLFAKWLFGGPRLLIADEPTRGVDVGAKRAIYELIHSLAAEGVSVLVISSELEEVLGLAHRVLVLRSGRLVAEYDHEEMSEERVMHSIFATDQSSTSGTSS